TEIFHSIQGEGTQAGRPCVFIRLTGCHQRCVWCDTEYAFTEGSKRSLEEILEEVRSHGCNLVEVTGGEPLLQPNCIPLLDALLNEGYEVMLETGGALDIAPVDTRVKRIVDLKCPSSGEAFRNRYENLPLLTPHDEVKFVVGDRGDYEWARGLAEHEGLTDRCTVLFSPVFGQMDYSTLAEWILADRLPVRFQVQLHKHIWEPSARGV
ncbi:MAG TPA: 7-carboxy-7-deazaguanine synthase QueE, partial [bacterium]|nr:7-carboxy-7-deazaguanine synthase QueE [bacterium]